MAELSSITRESARGGFFLFSGAAIASIILAISAIIMGRLLGPELYGQYNLVLVIPTLLLIFTDLGINAGVTKYTASLRAQQKSERIPAIIRYGMLTRLSIGIFISVLSIVFSSYFALIINRPDLNFYIQIASLSVVFQVIFTTSNSAFVGLDKSEYSALTTTVRAVLTTILQVALVFLSFNLFGALIGFVGGFLVSSLIGAAMLSIKFIRPLKTKINPSLNQSGRQVMGLLAQYGMPVYVSVVLTGLFPLYQQIVLAFFTTDVAIGNFRAAYNFVTLLAVVSISIMTALLPAFAKLENSLPETISAFFNKANKYTCLLLVPLTTVVIVLSQPIVQLLYGSIYTSAALFLSLNCSVYLLAIIGYMTLTSLFNGLGMTRLTLNTTLISFTILLILSPILAQYFDVAGAIIAYLVAVTVATSYAANIAVRKVKIKFSFKPTLSIFAISLIASIIPVALMFLTSLNSVIVLVIGGVSFVFVFITLVPVFGVISNGELTVIESMVQRIPVLKKIAKLLIIYARKIMVLFHKQL